MAELMLSYKEPVIPLDKEAVNLFISPPGLTEGKLTASAAAVRCAGLSSFIKFLVTAANKAEFAQADVGAAGMQLLYVNRLRLIQDMVAKSVAEFTMLAKRESVQTKQMVAMPQPEKAQQQAQAIQNYARKGHWNAMLEELCRLC
jgi:hypothetical protein